MLWSQKIVIFFVPNDYSYGQLTKIQNFYLSLRLWSNRERFLVFQLLNSRESKFGDIYGDKYLGIIISLQYIIFFGGMKINIKAEFNGTTESYFMNTNYI
jgi:hypothetical protein